MTNNRIKELRKLQGITQVELAEKINVTQGSIQKLENGIMDLTTKWMEILSNALNVKPYELLPEEWQPKSSTGNLSIEDICMVLDYMEKALIQKKINLPLPQKINLFRILLEVAEEEPANQNNINSKIEVFRKMLAIS